MSGFLGFLFSKSVLLIFGVLNLLGLLLMGTDKILAKAQRRRIPEATLLWSAALGGGLGAIAGMYLFRHKTRKRKFTLGLPALTVLHGLVIAGLYYLLKDVGIS